MYIFGGVNQVGLENILIQFKFNTRIAIVSKVETKGKPPSSTYPIVHQYKPNIMLILSGERSNRSLSLYRIA
jgi:hypothetical protein